MPKAEVAKKAEISFFEKNLTLWVIGCMIVGVLDYDNPFRRIRLSCIKGFKIVDNEVAVVMEQSILFFNNSTGAIKINFRCDDDPWWKRLFSWLKPGRDGQKNACLQ